MIEAHLYTPPPSLLGFDIDQPVTNEIAQAFVQRGYRFVGRYVRQGPSHNYDLSVGEINTILGAGLALFVVQHVPLPGWKPDGALGTAKGTIAASEVEKLGLPPGIMVVCDLEGVDRDQPASKVITYCNNWHAAVAGAGFLPMLYVGYSPIINAHDLYYRLRFTHYWSAYNLNVDEIPVMRGVQMKQRAARTVDQPMKGTVLEFDVDTTQRDNLGGLPVFLGPVEWGLAKGA